MKRRQKQRTVREQHRQTRRTNRQARRAQKDSTPPRRKLALALQGGGSHGAFTWGVLDRLLDETTIDIVGVTGTSAGAMSGALLVDGLLDGGPTQARAKLRRYWEAVGAAPGFGSFFSGVSGEEAANTALESIPACAEKMRQNLSPYDLSPSNSALHLLLSELIDFNRMRLQNKIQLTICATNARTAKRRVFTNHDSSFEVLLASTCLPQYFRAVEIDGEAYWDGGWTGNPALAPLLTKMPDCDLIIVRVDPVHRRELPRSLPEIFNRTLEIRARTRRFGWNSARLPSCCVLLMNGGRRLGEYDFILLKLARSWKNFPVSSKLNNYPPLLEYLFDLGRQTCDRWIAQHGEALCQRSTLDVQQLLPGHIWDNL